MGATFVVDRQDTMRARPSLTFSYSIDQRVHVVIINMFQTLIEIFFIDYLYAQKDLVTGSD
jgi:hypothetical protein